MLGAGFTVGLIELLLRGNAGARSLAQSASDGVRFRSLFLPYLWHPEYKRSPNERVRKRPLVSFCSSAANSSGRARLSGWENSGLSFFATNEVFVFFALADDAKTVAFHQNLGWAGTGIVVGGRDESIGAGGANCQQVAWHDIGDLAVAREKVARFAYWPHHVGGDCAGITFAQRNDLVIGLVQRGTDEIVHGRIDDHKLAIAVGLAIKDARQQQAGFGHDGAARLDQDLDAMPGCAPGHFLDEFANGWRLVTGLVGHAQAASQIQSPNSNAGGAQPLDQRDHLIEDLEHGCDLDDLRADVAADAVQS